MKAPFASMLTNVLYLQALFALFAGTSDATLLDRGAPHACAFSREFILLIMENKNAQSSVFPRSDPIKLCFMAGDAMCCWPAAVRREKVACLMSCIEPTLRLYHDTTRDMGYPNHTL